MSSSPICNLLFLFVSITRVHHFSVSLFYAIASPRLVSSRLVASRLAMSKLRHRFSHFCAAQRSIGYIRDDASICCFVTTEPTIDARVKAESLMRLKRSLAQLSLLYRNALHVLSSLSLPTSEQTFRSKRLPLPYPRKPNLFGKLERPRRNRGAPTRKSKLQVSRGPDASFNEACMRDCRTPPQMDQWRNIYS